MVKEEKYCMSREKKIQERWKKIKGKNKSQFWERGSWITKLDKKAYSKMFTIVKFNVMQENIKIIAKPRKDLFKLSGQKNERQAQYRQIKFKLY